MPGLIRLFVVLMCCATLLVAEEGGDSDGGRDGGDELGGQAADLVQRQARRQEAAAQFERGRELEAQEHFEQAEAAYRQALLVLPGNPEVRRAWRRVRRLLGESLEIEAPHGADLSQVQAQAAVAELRRALKQAEMMAADGRFEAARELLHRAQVLVERHPDQDFGDAPARVAALIERLAAHDRRSRRQGEQQLRQDALDEAHDRQRVHRQEQRSRLDERLARIEDLARKAFYELALAQARRLVVDHPESARAERLYHRLIDQTHEQRRLSVEQRERELKKEINARIHEALIPEGFDGQPSFPGDWMVRGARRASALEELAPVPEWQLALRNQLAGRLDIAFEGLEIATALEEVARRGQFNLVVAPELRAAGTPVSLRATGLRIDSILNFLTRQAQVSWHLQNEAVWVGSERVEEAVLNVYDAEHVTFAPPDVEGVDVALMTAGGSGGNFNLFGDAGGGFDDGDAGIAPEDLVDLIQESVAPAVWDNPDYSIAIRRTRLLVNAPTRVHELIREFLRSQLFLNNVLVRLRLQWLAISDEYMEEIGVDWHELGQNLLVAPFNDGYNNQRPEWSLDGRVVNNLPSSAVNLGGSAIDAGLRLQYLHLDTIDISAILTAQERTRKVRSLDGVELTTLNGVQASAAFIRQIAYISDYEVAAGGNFDPVIETLNVGRVLEVKPLVSADRKYVSVDLRPVTASATFFVENIVAQRIFGRGPGSGGTVFTSNFPLELPTVRVRSAGTRVMIPDRGSILVGGFGDHVEQHAETQVPLLGHIPFLGRLFGKRGRYHSRSQTYLTVTARIILYNEEEANL